MEYSGALWTLILEKNLKLKILCQPPFKLQYSSLAGGGGANAEPIEAKQAYYSLIVPNFLVS
jgi:hypothetical protein